MDDLKLKSDINVIKKKYQVLIYLITSENCLTARLFVRNHIFGESQAQTGA